MSIQTLGLKTGEFLISEANGARSREKRDVINSGSSAITSGTLLKAGATASDPYEPIAAAETPVAILLEGVPATTTALRTTYERDCEVNRAHLVYPTGANASQIAAIDAALAGLGIVIR